MINIRKGACIAFKKKNGILVFGYILDATEFQVLYLKDDMYRQTESRALVREGFHIPFTTFVESAKEKAFRDRLSVTSAQVKKAMKVAKKDTLCNHSFIKEVFQEAIEMRTKKSN